MVRLVRALTCEFHVGNRIFDIPTGLIGFDGFTTAGLKGESGGDGRKVGASAVRAGGPKGTAVDGGYSTGLRPDTTRLRRTEDREWGADELRIACRVSASAKAAADKLRIA